MNIEQIEVTIGTDGKVRLQTSGFSGDACLEATEAVEALLGDQVISRERTAETYDMVQVRHAEKVNIRR
ncbi:MAG: DUF2997 domain-containing protein [Flexilinea sp.]|nr:DUF2997 domain-containing protein [Flexilinea sp.]